MRHGKRKVVVMWYASFRGFGMLVDEEKNMHKISEYAHYVNYIHLMLNSKSKYVEAHMAALKS